MKAPGAVVVALVLGLLGAGAVGVMLAIRDIHVCLETSFWAMNVASVVGPLLALVARRFWTATAVAIVGWGALFMALPPIGPALTGRQYGENAMVFLLPLVLFPSALGVAGLLRLGWWAWRRRGATEVG